MTAHKYHAIPTEVDGILFASRLEARRYSELRLMGQAGEIRDLELQPRYPIRINGQLVCTYVADFRYFDVQRNREVVEDVKGVRTREFVLKKKLVKAVYGIDIEEVTA